MNILHYQVLEASRGNDTDDFEETGGLLIPEDDEEEGEDRVTKNGVMGLVSVSATASAVPG